MKKLAFLLAALLLLSACATPAEPVVTTEAPMTEATVMVTEQPTEAPTETEAAPSETEEASVLDIALTFIDKSVEELKAVLGEPDDTYYEDSCSGDGDDGFLYYGDVTVFTYREADGSAETVIDAERND
ncbi:MAG: hypothetical protein IJG45_06180 [Oscillospiraceae bacterium]|nr:hypothetical protein [Oscillospiraceae bacterium]